MLWMGDIQLLYLQTVGILTQSNKNWRKYSHQCASVWLTVVNSSAHPRPSRTWMHSRLNFFVTPVSQRSWLEVKTVWWQLSLIAATSIWLAGIDHMTAFPTNQIDVVAIGALRIWGKLLLKNGLPVFAFTQILRIKQGFGEAGRIFCNSHASQDSLHENLF